MSLNTSRVLCAGRKEKKTGIVLKTHGESVNDETDRESLWHHYY